MERVDHAKEAIRIIDEVLAEQDRQFVALDQMVKEEVVTEVEAEQLYWNWINHGKSIITEADITIEGDPHITIYDPNQGSLWD